MKNFILVGSVLVHPAKDLLNSVFFFLQENPDAPDAETLLNGHMAKWQDIRKSWKQSAANNEKRYSESMKILTTMYEK